MLSASGPIVLLHACEMCYGLQWVGSLRICSKKSSEEELCYAATETQLKGRASKQSCIRGRNRRRLFGVIDQWIGGGYTAAKYGAVSGPQPGCGGNLALPPVAFSFRCTRI